ncbi:MAG: lipopolysaccharide biosynthesis protein [Armatimonadota bacterium]
MSMTEPASVSERAVRDTAKQVGGQLAVGIFAVGFAAWLNRMLPAQELAVWPLCVSLGAVVSGVASLGLGDTFVRVIPALQARGEREEASALLRTGVLLHFIACAILSVGVYFAAGEVARYLLHDEKLIGLVRPMALAGFFLGFGERLMWTLQSVQEFGKRAMVNAITGIIRTPLAVVLYLLMHGPIGVVVALTITPLLGCILGLLWLWRHLSHGRRFASAKQVLKFSLPFYGVSLTGILCGRMNQLVIAYFVAPQVLAAYFIASSISSYIASVDHFAVDATTPKLSEKGALADGIEDTERVFTKCSRYLFLGLIPLHLLVAVAATPLLQLYGGSQYAHVGPVLAVQCLGLLVSTFFDLHRAHVIVFAKPTHLFALQMVNTVSNLSLLIILVPRYEALGAALTDAFVAIILLIASVLLLRRTMRIRYDLPALGVASGSATAASLVLWAMQPLWHQHASPVLLGLTVGGVIYGLAVARYLKPEDVQLLVRCAPQRLRGITGRACRWSSGVGILPRGSA